MCSRTCSVVKKSVRSKLSEAVEALAGVEEQLYVSLVGILGRNVKRVQDGLKRVREAMETEGRSNAKDDFSTLDKKRKWIQVCVLRLVPFPLHTPQSLTRHTRSTGAVEYVLPTNRPPLIR